MRPRSWGPTRSPSRTVGAAMTLAAAISLWGCGGGPVTGAGGAQRPARPTPQTRIEPHASSHGHVVDLGAVGVRPPAPAARRTPGTPRLITHGPRSRRWVALTFDADMTPEKLAALRAGERGSTWYDPRILAELRRTRTPATIFLTGLWVRVHRGVARDLARSDRFELENHSVSHRAFRAPCFGLRPLRSRTEARSEIVDARRIIERAAGRRPRYFRFPGGCHSAADLRAVAAAGEQALGWDVVSGDAGEPNPAVVVRTVLEHVRPGSIVVMHLVGAPNAPATAAALPDVIRGLRARGYSLVTLKRLLSAGGGHGARP